MIQRRPSSAEQEISPNLIPMIDIMFLLLLFLMVSADLGQRELEDVKLPKAKGLKDDAPERVTVNVSRDGEQRPWRIHIRGRDYTDTTALKRCLAEDSRTFHTDPKDAHMSTRRVMIRADGGAPYGEVQRVMNACAENGIYRIECGVARSKE